MSTSLIKTLAGCAAASLLFGGCGNDAPKLSSSERALFENSTPEIKQIFEKAYASDKVNDYLPACTNYQALLNQPLTLDQSTAMQTALKSLKLRIFEAADKGDAGAKAALRYVNNVRSPRGN